MAESKMAARGKGPKLPVIMTANDLLDGEVVFLGEGGWTPDPAGALVARDEGTAESLEARAKADFQANRIVEPYLVEVALGEDGPAKARVIPLQVAGAFHTPYMAAAREETLEVGRRATASLDALPDSDAKTALIALMDGVIHRVG